MNQTARAVRHATMRPAAAQQAATRPATARHTTVRHAAALVAGAAAVVAGAALLVPAAAQAAPAAPATPVRAATVPATFKAASITWRTAQRGWVLGSAPCGRRRCTDVIGSSNGGTSWRVVGRIGAPIATGSTPPDAGVDEIRFATDTVGWAFGPALYHTTNGGRSWAAASVPGHGRQVIALTAGATGTYAVVSPCREFAVKCASQKLSFWRTASPSGRSWTRIPLALASDNSASIATFGTTVYVVAPGTADPSGGRLYASTDGRHFSRRPVPCRASQEIGLAQVVPTSPTRVALLCDGNPGFSQAVKTVYRSVNTGRSYTSAGTTGAFGIEAELAASTSGTLLVGAWSDGTFMYLNNGHRQAWSMVLGLGDGGAGWNDLAFVTSREAWAVYGPVSAFAANLGKLYVTRSGGRRWSLARL
jgi:hypothetical protein